MEHVLAAPAPAELHSDVTAYRLRLYGLGVILALSSMLVANWLDDSQLWAPVCLPVAAMAMLVTCITGAEYQLFAQRVDHERQALYRVSERAETEATERQQCFNRIWQDLADHRGEPVLPASVMSELAALFEADLVVAWAADPDARGFDLRGAHPLDVQEAGRLEKVARLTPCFHGLSNGRQPLRIHDFTGQTTPALAWFCEDAGLKSAVFCPVLVRHELVGVLSFFFRQERRLTAKATEEMQAAAHLFLCAF